MVVIQINSECGRGSTGKIVCAISKAFTDKKVENYIFYSGNHKSDFANGIQINGKPSIRIHQLLSRVFGDQGFHSYFSTKRMVKKIEGLKPDVILLHNIHGYYLHMGVLFRFLKKLDKPVYWTLHDCWAFTGHCTYFLLSNCNKWKDGCQKCPSIHEYPYSWLFDRSASLYKNKKKLFSSLKSMTVITPSKWLYNLVNESFLSSVSNAVVINNGINTEVFTERPSNVREKYGLANKVVILGVASVWAARKGIDYFIELNKIIPNNYRIILVGTDARVDRILPENIISIHRTQNQIELAEIYSSADVFVNPTLEDNYPTVNMEAIACGTPVVSFDTGGASEMLDEETGIAIKKQSAEEILEAVNTIIKNQTTYKNGCKKRRLLFSEEISIKKYCSLLLGE